MLHLYQRGPIYAIRINLTWISPIWSLCLSKAPCPYYPAHCILRLWHCYLFYAYSLRIPESDGPNHNNEFEGRESNHRVLGRITFCKEDTSPYIQVSCWASLNRDYQWGHFLSENFQIFMQGQDWFATRSSEH